LNSKSSHPAVGVRGCEVTRELAAFAAKAHYDGWPGRVAGESARAFLNWMGCVLGGCREPAVERAAAAAVELGGGPQATAIGRGVRTDVATAAFLNCLSSSVLAFDDTHLATVTHPTGPVAATLFACSEGERVSGEEFMNALILGIEIECRMSNVLLRPPAQSHVGFYATGLTGPIGAAIAVGRLLRLDERGLMSAVGLAATQAAGFRATHGSMAGSFVPAAAARAGLFAARLAAKGFDCSAHALEAPGGFVDVFSTDADPALALDRLGHDFEILNNAYKPYPCGIVIHPAIDACLELAHRMEQGRAVTGVRLVVHPLALHLGGRRDPATPHEAQVSLFHWAAAALARGAAGLAESRQACIDDPGVAEWKRRIDVAPDQSLQRDEAIAEAILADGARLRAHVGHARGSLDRPMTDDELDSKFRMQAAAVLPAGSTETLLRRCREAASLRDVGTEIAAAWLE
jgi:2-methylcitrate dehydratase PrpD